MEGVGGVPIHRRERLGLGKGTRGDVGWDGAPLELVAFLSTGVNAWNHRRKRLGLGKETRGDVGWDWGIGGVFFHRRERLEPQA
jgi:hypothetical protein